MAIHQDQIVFLGLIGFESINTALNDLVTFEAKAAEQFFDKNLVEFVIFGDQDFCIGYRYSLGVDLLTELEDVSKSVSVDFADSACFAGRLVFKEETILTRHAFFALQQRLQFDGLQMVILPIRVLVTTRRIKGEKIRHDPRICEKMKRKWLAR